jgi:hypothetical protein
MGCAGWPAIRDCWNECRTAQHLTTTDDVVGIAYSTAGLNRQHREYLADGGMGGFIGDGQLTNYACEEVVETYYNYQLHILDNTG